MKAEDIPDDFIERQLNETKYISKRIKKELSKIASGKVSTSVGAITSKLRAQWGMDKMMKELQRPRYEKLAADNPTLAHLIINNSNPNVEKLFGYTKRNDHRHHAIDALVVACTRNSIIKQMNDLNKIADSELKRYENRWTKSNGKTAKVTEFKRPMAKRFKDTVKAAAENIIVSIPPDKKLMHRPRQKYAVTDENGRKRFVVRKPSEIKGNAWAVRAELHEETAIGLKKSQVSEFLSLDKILVSSNPLDIYIVDEVLRENAKSFVVDFSSAKKANMRKFLRETGLLNRLGKKVLLDDLVELRRQFFVKRVEFGGISSKAFWNIVDQEIIFSFLHFLGYPLAYVDPFIDSYIAKSKAWVSQNIKDWKTAVSFENILKFNEFRINSPSRTGKMVKHRIVKVKTIDAEVLKSGAKIQIPRINSNNDKLFVLDGSNFCINFYEKNGKRKFETLSNFTVVEMRLQGVLELIGEKGLSYLEEGYTKLFSLHTNDYVYLKRTKDEDITQIDWNQKYAFSDRVFALKVITKSERCYFKPHNFAKGIEDTKHKTFKEYTDRNGFEIYDVAGELLNMRHWVVKLNIDRLGNITSIEK